VRNADHQAGRRQEEPGPHSILCVPEREVMGGVHLITEEGQTPDTLDGVGFEALFPPLDENDPGLVQGLVPAPFLDGLEVNPVQIATKVYGAAGGTSRRRVAGDKWPVERRQLESIEPLVPRVLTQGGAISGASMGGRAPQTGASGSAAK
jgi:hypothetical protein